MKRIAIIFLSFMLFTGSVFANGYCDSRPTPNDVNNCYNASIAMFNNIVLNNYKMLMGSMKYPAQDKAALQQDQIDWEHNVNKLCRTNSCVEKSLEDRAAFLSNLYKTRAK